MYRVLLVDDEPIVLESLSSIIPWKDLDLELIGTSLNGMDAFNRICDDYPDIVITDIRMPILDGLELIEKAKKLDADIDFIVLSGYDDFSFAQTAMQFGVRYYHLKPVRKEELISTLHKMTAELNRRKTSLLEQERAFVERLKLPLQKCFLHDAFSHADFPLDLIRRYSQLFQFPKGDIALCVCTFLEPECLSHFLTDFFSLLKRQALTVLWPAFYVTNSFVFLYPVSAPRVREIFRQFIQSRQYPSQSVELECQFFTFPDAVAALRETVHKVSRYRTVILINENQKPEPFTNALYATDMGIGKRLLENMSSEYKADRLLQEAFDSITDVENAILLCIQLLFSSPLFSEREFDYYTLQRLFRSSSVEEVRNMATSLLSGQLPSQIAREAPQKATLIPRVKSYVEAHLDSETLSLKWLAENQFFISVGYLSKQFLLEEGEHFSSYLTRQRMELARKLMRTYRDYNIQDIAQQVGFRSNPRYFSQVFKKYTGMTPNEYRLSLKQEE